MAYNNGYDPNNQYNGYNPGNPYNNNGYNPTDPYYNNGYNMNDPYSNNGYNNGYNSAAYNNQGYYTSQAKLISNEAYNMIIGGVLLYGFIINCIMTACFGNSIMNFVYGSPAAFYISYFVLAIAGTFMIKKSDSAVISFIGYNLIVIPIGMVIASVVTLCNIAYGSNIVTMAFAMTAVVTLVMMFVSTIFPNFFLSLGRTLGITLLITIVVEAIMFFVGADLPIIDYIVVLIFCGYVGYDWSVANRIEKTADNAIDSAAELYLDIANLFLRLMRILARANNN